MNPWAKTWKGGLITGKGIGQHLITFKRVFGEDLEPSLYTTVIPGVTVLGPSLSWGLPHDPEGQNEKPKRKDNIDQQLHVFRVEMSNMVGFPLWQKSIPLPYPFWSSIQMFAIAQAEFGRIFCHFLNFLPQPVHFVHLSAACGHAPAQRGTSQRWLQFLCPEILYLIKPTWSCIYNSL